jgi:hypothetical protein
MTRANTRGGTSNLDARWGDDVTWNRQEPRQSRAQIGGCPSLARMLYYCCSSFLGGANQLYCKQAGDS